MLKYIYGALRVGKENSYNFFFTLNVSEILSNALNAEKMKY